jgi:hypothetical protein
MGTFQLLEIIHNEAPDGLETGDPAHHHPVKTS